MTWVGPRHAGGAESQRFGQHRDGLGRRAYPDCVGALLRGFELLPVNYSA
ncbi:MAG: hypothetical protein ACM3ZE_16735 [Myxococcales bacterium]